MRDVGFFGPGRIGNMPSFGRQMTAAELEQVRPLVRQDPRLDDTVADRLETRYCSVMDSPAGKLGMFLNFPRLAVEAIADKIRESKAIRAYRDSGGMETIVSLQWVRFPQSRSDTLELSVPCKGEKCPMTKDGKPATGRAVLGRDMISWRIYEAPDPAS